MTVLRDQLDANHAVRRLERQLHAIANEYFAPGLEHDDLVQAARIGVFYACRDFNPARAPGGFDPFALMCARRKVHDMVTGALRAKHEPVNQARALDEPPPCTDWTHGTLADTIEAPRCAVEDIVERHADLLDALHTIATASLTVIEREVFVAVALRGETYTQVGARTGLSFKGVDNAMQRARRKLTEQRVAA